jgi:hypothetical protein
MIVASDVMGGAVRRTGEALQESETWGGTTFVGDLHDDGLNMIGAGIGIAAGIDFVIALVVAGGTARWGVRDMALWPTALNALRPALLNGIFGLIAAPVICALAAWLPVRAIMRAAPIRALESRRF